MKAKDLRGKKFSRLTAVSIVGINRHRCAVWLCICDCGNTHQAVGRDLGKSIKSCGCLFREGNNRRTHGMFGTKTYHSWASMVSRCTDPNQPCAKNYIGRGIKCCDRWLRFENFLEDMGERPDGTSLDRIDNNGNYEPGNCRWATRSQQCRNTRRNRTFTVGGKRMCLREVSELYGVNYGTLMSRLNRGIPLMEAIL